MLASATGVTLPSNKVKAPPMNVVTLPIKLAPYRIFLQAAAKFVIDQ